MNFLIPYATELFLILVDKRSDGIYFIIDFKYYQIKKLKNMTKKMMKKVYHGESCSRRKR